MPRISRDMRIKIVSLSETGMSQRGISVATGIGLKTVNRIVQAMKKDGRIEDAPRRPRPDATCTNKEILIVAAVVDDDFLTAPELLQLQLDASLATIRRRLLEAGCIAALLHRSRFLMIEFKTPVRHLQRVQKEGASRVGEVVFTDECSFSSHWDQQHRVWRLDYIR